MSLFLTSMFIFPSTMDAVCALVDLGAAWWPLMTRISLRKLRARLQYLQCVSIVGTLGCVFITHESGVTKCTTGEAWSAFSWHHSSVFHCQWTHNQGCVFIDNETHESGVTKCTTGEAWSAFSWHHSSVFHCQWTHNQVFLLLSHMQI